jgi:hypothetical protein
MYIYICIIRRKQLHELLRFLGLEIFRDSRGSSITSRRKLSQATTSQMLSDFQSDFGGTKVRPPRKTIGTP